MPKEHYELAVLRHQLTDPDSGDSIPCRVIFGFSSADQKVCQTERQRAVTKIRAGLEQIAQSVTRGHFRWHDPVPIHRRVVKLFGKRAAARYFRWELVPLSADERAVLPPPQRGCRRPTHRFVFHYDEAAAQADAADDGYSALLTTAPVTRSADTLFTEFKQQCYVEQSHHQWKTPLAVRPLFLKSPQRVEALVYLLKIALTAYHLLQRLYRQAIPADAPITEKASDLREHPPRFSCLSTRQGSDNAGLRPSSRATDATPTSHPHSTQLPDTCSNPGPPPPALSA